MDMDETDFQDDQDLHNLLQTKSTTKKERLMGSTIRDLGNTIKEARSFLLTNN